MYRKTAGFIVHAIALGAMIAGLLLAAPAFAAGPTTLAGLRCLARRSDGEGG